MLKEAPLSSKKDQVKKDQVLRRFLLARFGRDVFSFLKRSCRALAQSKSDSPRMTLFSAFPPRNASELVGGQATRNGEIEFRSVSPTQFL